LWIRNLHWETKCVRRFPERIGTLQGSYAILEQQYDPVGRAYKASNPTTAAPNIGSPRNSTDWGHPTKTTAVNWLIYFGIAEALFTALSRFSRQKP